MTHNEERKSWYREGLIGLSVGVLYGTTSVCVGHPFDTIKTKMQAQKGYERHNMINSFVTTLRSQGIKGLYRGAIPPLCGSGVYRSVQFAVFESVYTAFDSPLGKWEVPYSGGLQLRVILGGLCASTVRATIETPLELAKVRRQTEQSWKLTQLYSGYSVTLARTIGLMCTYFILVDSGRRLFPDTFKRPVLGPFLTSGLAATIGWWVIWPLENMKSQVQGQYGRSDVSVLTRMCQVIRERGFFALYRGIGPGTIRSFLANGISMIVMSFAHRKISELGLR